MGFLSARPDIAHAGADRPADHVLVGVGGQQRLELRLVHRFFPEPYRPRNRVSGSPACDYGFRRNADLSGANLPNANLLGAKSPNADLSRTDLSNVNLRDANLMHANLYQANLGSADLSKADLSGASLMQASLHNANLSGVNLSGVNLSGANLSGANLSGASDISQGQLDKTCGTKVTLDPGLTIKPC
jgi:uncharacterized protein YjbI with pentapeptide repeats